MATAIWACGRAFGGAFRGGRMSEADLHRRRRRRRRPSRRDRLRRLWERHSSLILLIVLVGGLVLLTGLIIALSPPEPERIREDISLAWPACVWESPVSTCDINLGSPNRCIR